MKQTPYATVAEAIAQVGTDFPENGYVFQDSRGVETRYPFPEIEKLTAHRAGALQALGLQKGDRFGLIVIEPEDFVLTFLAGLRIGALPVPLYPPLSYGSLDAYAARTARILSSAGAKVMVASTKLQNVLWSLVDDVPSMQKLVRVEDLRGVEVEPDYPEIAPDDLAFLQYTSGSTSDPKGVMVTHANLVANVNGIMGEQGLSMDPHVDSGVTWLPLYHDMGLIGFVIAPICWGVEIVFIPTVRFLWKPSVWLDAMHRHQATATFGPNFAYALATRRVKQRDLETWDLSRIKAFGCGAEPIHVETITAFEERFAACGLRKNAFLPAYGMAEATLAISFKPLGQEWKHRLVDGDVFESEGKAHAHRPGTTRLEHVSCGHVFPGHEVAVISPETGEFVPEGVQGELCLKGPSVTPGYFQNPEATAMAFRDGWLHTGDLGYLLEGEVYVTGRMKDLIIINGRNIHPQSVEWAVAEVEGVRKGNVVAFSRPGAHSEELVVALETKLQEEGWVELVDEVKKAVQRELQLSVADVVCLKAGSLPKTSSGKLQRAKTRLQYLQSTLGTEGSRSVGATADRITLARHVARSMWSRAKAAVLFR